jgi:hypothetical protein
MFRRSTSTSTSVGNGSIRATQAKELLAAGGPMRSPLPVVALADWNSNVPGVQPGDEQAFQAVLNAGFKRRSTQIPESCCADLFTGTLADFDHVVDMVVANRRKIKRIKSGVVGLSKIGAVYPSDHAGVWSNLRVPRP